MKSQDKQRRGMMALKLDMAKAYDRVQWVFFGEVDEQNRFLQGMDWVDYEMCIEYYIFF